MVLEVEGMTCGACVGRVERGLGGVKGVRSVEANLAAGACKVVFDR
jgi:copper chaperone CopZ